MGRIDGVRTGGRGVDRVKNPCCVPVRDTVSLGGPLSKSHPAAEESKYVASGAAGDEDESHILPHKRKVLPRPASILKTSTGQYVPSARVPHAHASMHAHAGRQHCASHAAPAFHAPLHIMRKAVCWCSCACKTGRGWGCWWPIAVGCVQPNLMRMCGCVVVAVRAGVCSVPSPRASLERKISFADLKGRDLEEVNFCDNLHYSKQARRRFWFFSS